MSVEVKFEFSENTAARFEEMVTKGEGMSTRYERVDRVYDLVEEKKVPWFCPAHYEHEEPFPNEVNRTYDLTWYQRIYLTFEQPQSSKFASYFSNCMLVVILLNICSAVAQTMSVYNIYYPTPPCPGGPACDNDPVLCPGMIMCEPQPLPIFDKIDAACVYIFTIEYMIRLCISPFVPTRLSFVMDVRWDSKEKEMAKLEHREAASEPFLPWYWQVHYYFWRPKNLVDMVAIMPYYVKYSGESANLSFIRVLRLFRVLRAFKARPSGGIVTVVWQSLMDSAEVLSLLLFVCGMIVLIYGSIIFTLEQGTYTINANYPTGVYLRNNVYYNSLEESPFKGSLYGMYWAIVTMTTVGYGDIVATSPAGRVVSCIAALTGLLILALPISVLGNNFNMEFSAFFSHQKKLKKKKMEEASKKLLAKKIARERQLDSIEEAEKIVQEIMDSQGRLPTQDEIVWHRPKTQEELDGLVWKPPQKGFVIEEEEEDDIKPVGMALLDDDEEEEEGALGQSGALKPKELDASTWRSKYSQMEITNDNANVSLFEKRVKYVSTMNAAQKILLCNELLAANKLLLARSHVLSSKCEELSAFLMDVVNNNK